MGHGDARYRGVLKNILNIILKYNNVHFQKIKNKPMFISFLGKICFRTSTKVTFSID